jgi:hypothetical protein
MPGQFQAFDKGRKAVLNLDFRRIAAQGFGVHMRQNQPGFRAEWQAQRYADPVPGASPASTFRWAVPSAFPKGQRHGQPKTT